MKGRRYLLAALLGLVNAANAMPFTDWSGIYIGPQATYHWANTRWIFPQTEYYNLAPNQGFKVNPSGGTVGAMIGWAYQNFPYVYGVEASANIGAIKDKKVGPVTSAYPLDFFETKIDKLATATARVGFAQDLWVGYLSGGYAAAHIKLKANSGNPGPGVLSETDGTQSGWMLGAGVDYMFVQRAFIGLRYDFIRLKGRNYSTTTKGTQVGQPFHAKFQPVNMNTITARLNMLF